jgi:superfamily I DNA and/or RNA helicase
MNLDGILDYYKECFREDSADFNLRNLLRLSKEDILFIKDKDEVASGELHRLPILPSFGESLSKRAEIYQRERVILHCSFFVTGQFSTNTNDDSTSLFSPLVTSEAKIESDEYGYYFSIGEGQSVVNEELLSLLLPEIDNLPDFDTNRLYDPSYWGALLDNSPYEINLTEAMRFPLLASRSDASKAIKRNDLTLLPISTLAFVERSSSSRGVLHELTSIQGNKTLSAPLKSLLSQTCNDGRVTNVNSNRLPALLSEAQKKVLTIGATQTLGIVSGPPGTGKSYTIAAVAAEHVTRNESVLIVAGSETALDVIADKLKNDFSLENFYVRAGQKTFLRDFKQYLSDLLAGYYNFEEAKELQVLQKEVDSLVDEINVHESTILKLCKRAIKLGNRSHKIENNSANFWERLTHRVQQSSIDGLKDLWSIQQHFNKKFENKEEKSAQYLRSTKAYRMSNLLSQDRKTVQTLNRAVRARTSSKQAEYFSSANFDSLLNGFPVWLVTLNTLHRVLPLTSEMFDLVIIDEATQCNIASSLPAFQRAKRAMVVGDQKQLRHFSFLSKAKEAKIAKERAPTESELLMSYRDNSILDLALCASKQQLQIAFLDEHFRSQPELINFSNKLFYNNKLKVMQHRPCSSSGHIKLIRLEGKRHTAGYNKLEAEAVIEQIQRVIELSKQTGQVTSIGVLSPFSKQVKYIAELIENTISLEEIKLHNLKVATPYGFQGEERDTMLLSFSLDNFSLRAAAYLNKRDVFNVAVTRARTTQHLFVSIDEKILPTCNLLKQYLASIQQFSIEHSQSEQPDKFQNEIIKILVEEGLECWGGYEMLCTYIDVLVRHKYKYVAIDLIGYPGPWADYFELNTYKLIKRAGINFVPLSYSLWLKDKGACLEAIREQL